MAEVRVRARAELMVPFGDQILTLPICLPPAWLTVIAHPNVNPRAPSQKHEGAIRYVVHL